MEAKVPSAVRGVAHSAATPHPEKPMPRKGVQYPISASDQRDWWPLHQIVHAPRAQPAPQSGVPADLRVPRGNKSAVCEGLATPSAPAACGQPKPTNPAQRECYKAIKAETVGARVYTHPTGHAHARGL